MLSFQWPYFFLILPFPFLVNYLWPAKKEDLERQGQEIRFPHLSHLKSAFGSTGFIKPNQARLMFYLLMAVWSLLTLALMRPQIVDQVTNVKNKGHDLMLAVDLSGSMQSLDFETENGGRASRLDVAKSVVKDFVKKRSGDRVGLILFGEHAYLNSPLTLDTTAVSKMLDNSTTGMAGDATAIGDAIGLAVKNLRDRPAQSRALILLTDGEDNSSTIPPVEAAKLAQSYGIHIYTIVVGKEGIVPFPDGHGGTVMVESHVDTTLTRKIAELTGGEFYKTDDQKALEKIYARIDSLEKSEADSQHFLIRHPLYQYPLGIGLILFAALGWMTQARRNSYGF